MRPQPTLRHLLRDESGMSLVYVAIGFMTFMAASTLAIDVGMFMTARTQAQTSADAGALAGVTALVKNNWTDRSPTGPAVQSAIDTATKNGVMGAPPSVLSEDVTFPTDPAGNANRVRVVVHRITERNNAIPTLIGGLFGVPTVGINANATAEASPANAMTCVKPFMIPDKWIEHVDSNGKPDGSWTPDSTFDIVDKKDVPLPNPDVYVGTDPDVYPTGDYTGYTVANDVGTQLVLRAGTGNQANPSFYYSWKMPGDTGGNFYRDNIANCNTSLIIAGTKIIQEPGDMSGPTVQGIQSLIDKDPNTQWSDKCNCVTGSLFGEESPRVFPIPLFDPLYYAQGQAQGRTADFKISNFLGFYADHISGNQIYGRVTNIVGVVTDTATAAPTTSFPKAIRLVQ